ncbi:MAG: GGDEF domain-containing protein [Curvibacter sp. PD_MW3]|nr:MAG: GGDEF domain-containing protein [Curvibacter sp. PD_MW3]
MIVHTPSLMLVNIAVTATLGLSLGVVASRARRDGLALWAWAMGTHTLAYILFSLRGQISDVVFVVAATGLLSATIALFTEGLREFQQRRPAYGLSWFPVVLLMVGISALMPAPQARVALSNLILLLQGLAALVLLIQKRHDTIGRGQYFEMAGFAILALVFVLRMVGALATTTDLSSITASNQIQTVTFLLATVALVLVGIGLVIMTKERADAQNLNMALHDALTGLSNRRLIVETLTQNLAQAQRSGRALTLLMIDIDFFKRVNDTFGHQSGDLALRGLADCIRGRLRAQDMAGRWGGEEFLVVLPDTDAQGAGTLAEQLRRTVEQARFEATDGRTMQFTISIGLHALQAMAAESIDDMVAAADKAMYQAKQNGRNRVESL